MRPIRLEALADGIFAIVMTLLVLELKVPKVAHGVFYADDVLVLLLALWPKFAAFVASFWLLGFYWNSHHMMFGYVKDMNFGFLWRNFAFLMFVSLVPFSTAFLGEHPYLQISQIVYGINLIVCGLVVFMMFRYVLKNETIRDGDKAYSHILVRNVRGKLLLPPLIYSIGIAVSFMSTTWSLVIFGLGPITYLINIDHPLWQVIARPFTPQKP